jgi:hypothetical protein
MDDEHILGRLLKQVHFYGVTKSNGQARIGKQTDLVTARGDYFFNHSPQTVLRSVKVPSTVFFDHEALKERGWMA